MTAASETDLRWLDNAVRMARPRLGTTAENPTVAALIVSPDGETLLGSAVTAKGGRPHAEAQALDKAGSAAAGATFYCTLEPCLHWGRTPPCVDAVIRAGIKRIVVGMPDPDPRTAGQSLRRMAEAGIEVVVADHAGSKRLHEAHTTRIREGRPFITLKLAVSADDKIGRTGERQAPITGNEARDWTHMQRALSNAVLVGGATAEIDNPSLTVRIEGLERRTPLRIILAGSRGLDPRLTLIANVSGYPVAVIASSERHVDVPASIDVIRVPGTGDRPDLLAAMQALSRRGIARLLVEGGAILTEALLAARLVDRFELLRSPRRIGDGGVLATATGSIIDRLIATGYIQTHTLALGEDTLHTFERF